MVKVVKLSLIHILIEAMGQLGGMGTAGMVPAWCPFSDGEKIIYRGLAEKIFRASRKGVSHEPENKLDWVSINPEYLTVSYTHLRFLILSVYKPTARG